MSDYRAVAAVMATLQNLLQEAIREAVPGATVQTGPPEAHSPDQVGAGLIKIFLYKVEPNPTWRNVELPVRGADGRLLRRPKMAVNLDLLLSFYGDERDKVPYVLLGLTLAALHAEPYPDVRYMPRQADGDAVDRVSASLAGSGLERQEHALSFSMLPLTHEELVPLFSQIPYVMSVAYRAQVVLIEPYATPQPPLPVRRAELWVAEGRPPVLAAVAPQVLAFAPGAQVVLRGEGLADGPARVRFDDLEAVPEAQADGSLRVTLPDGVQAGTVMVRVVRETTPRGAPRPLLLASDPVALVVQPVVRGVSVSRLPTGEGGGAGEAGEAGGAGEAGETGAAGTVPAAELQVRFAPAVTSTRQGLVLLHPRQTEGEPPRRSLALPAVADASMPDRMTATAPVPPWSKSAPAPRPPLPASRPAT